MPLQKLTLDDIIAASIKVFRRKGYYRTSISDLAKETGLTKGVFYHHFENKEQIMKTALQKLCEYFDRRVFAIAYDQSLPAKVKLDQMVEVYLKAITRDPGGCFFANTILETAQNEDTFIEETKIFFDKWQAAMREIFRCNHTDSVADALSEEVITDLEGALILMQLNKDVSYLQRAIDRSKSKL